MAIRARGSSVQWDRNVDGKRRRETFATWKEAEAWDAEVTMKTLRGLPYASPVICPEGPERKTLGSFEQAARTTYAKFWKGTASDSKALVNIDQVARYFKDTPLDRIDTDAIDAFVEHCIAKRNSHGTINRKLAILSKTLSHAFDRGILAKLPKIHRKKEGAGRIRWLTGDEERTLLALLRTWDKGDHIDVITCLIDTGLRPSELYRLTPLDVNVDTKTLTVWMSKTGKPRSLVMTKRVLEVLLRRMAGLRGSECIFPYDNVWMRHVWDRARYHLGYADDPHFIPYICRHTCASRLAQRGVDLQVIKEWMGHTSVTMTMRYAHLSPRNMAAAAAALEEVE